MRGRSVLLAIVALAFVSCATASSYPNAPWIGPLTFTPSSFSIGQSVKISFEYKNVSGGISKSQVDLDFKGSLSIHTRTSSTFADLIRVIGGATESGTFETELRIAPSDPPPFDITYYLRVRDAAGRQSNESIGTVIFRRL